MLELLRLQQALAMGRLEALEEVPSPRGKGCRKPTHLPLEGRNYEFASNCSARALQSKFFKAIDDEFMSEKNPSNICH
jgi:hypothetical protein